MNKGLFIEITNEVIHYSYLEECSGFVRLDGVGSIQFAIFRNPVKKCFFRMRVFNKTMSKLVSEFEEMFTAYDYTNRKVIRWIGNNAENLILTRIK